MLRAFLLASPLVLALVSCGDSATSFDETTLPGGASAGATGATGGTESTGATSNTGGSDASAGKSSSGGTSSEAGTDSGTAGTETSGGGTKPTGGTGNSGGTKPTGGTGNESGSANNGGGGSGNGGGSGGSAGTGGTAEAGTTAGGSAGTGGTGGSTAGSGGSAGGPACPNVFGQYDIVNLQGACNGVSKDAPQSIQGTDVACFAHFVSLVVQGNPGVNGGAQMDESGSFTGATLYFGKAERKNCSGSWDQVEERMTVKCPVQNEICTVTMDLK